MSVTFKWTAGDIDVDANGKFSYVEDIEKGAQDVADALMTTLDERYDFGNILAVMQTASSETAAQALIASEVRNSIKRLQAKQREDLRSTPEERIASIDQLIVRFLRESEAYFYVRLTTETDEVVEKTFRIDLSHQLEPRPR